MMLFYYIYFFLIAAPVMLLATLLTSLTASIGCALFSSSWWGYYPMILWGKVMCWLTLVRVKTVHKGNVKDSQSYVFVANHQGAFDIFAIYGFLGHNFRWMMKESLKKIPVVGWACKNSGQVFVARGSVHGIAKTMQEAQKRLQGGLSLVVFPEGARSDNGKVANFKRGAFSLATEFNLPVVPVTIDGAFSVMPRTAKLPRPGHITVTVHDPIEANDPNLIEKSRQVIISALKDK
jgi:1-acyl-sn-glycerol-3-phosphate acyltransferase